WKAERSRREIFAHPMLYRRDILARHRAADDALFEIEARSPRQGTDLNMHIPVLTVPAALLLVAGMLRHHLADRLLIGHLRPAGLDIEPVFVTHAVDGDIEVNIPLPPEQHLLRILPLLDFQGVVLLEHLGEGK